MYQSPKYYLSVAKCIQVQLSKSKKSEDEMLNPKTGQNLKCFEGGGKKVKEATTSYKVCIKTTIFIVPPAQKMAFEKNKNGRIEEDKTLI